MMPAQYRSTLRLLLFLHPKAFREQFADEMMLVFEDAYGDGVRHVLLLDALSSLLRQLFSMHRARVPKTADAFLFKGTMELMEEQPVTALVRFVATVLTVLLFSHIRTI